MKASFKITKEKNFTKISIFGTWDKDSIANYTSIPFELKDKNFLFDFSKLLSIDSAGVRFFLALEYDLNALGYKVQRANLSQKFTNLFVLCEKNYQRTFLKEKNNPNLFDYFSMLGFKSCELFKVFINFISFFGAFCIALFNSFKHPKNFRFISFLYHIEHSAIKALGIVILTALLVGVVLAYQAASLLFEFGANIFIVDLIGISATRELAPLIVAIVIAGRSASSYTAQIGVMKITDEIAAMNTMGFQSFDFIIIPRVMALVVAMPLVVAISDFFSILGAMIIAKTNLGISFEEFMRRFKEAIALKHIIIGLLKAPIFGLLIGLIACFRGFEVKNTTQSIGLYTTKSVVSAIFWVIAFDALFSVLLTKMGI